MCLYKNMILPPLPLQQGNQDKWPSNMYETVTENGSDKKREQSFILCNGHD